MTSLSPDLQSNLTSTEPHRPPVTNLNQSLTASHQQPPAPPADVPDALLVGVTSQPVSVVRGPSRIWTGAEFETVEAITAIIF